MVTNSSTITLIVGATKVEFRLREFLRTNGYTDVTIAMTLPNSSVTFTGEPTLLSLAELTCFADYVQRALVSNAVNDDPFVSLNLGFEFLVSDNDDYATTIDIFVLAAEPENDSRSYVGCRGSVTIDLLSHFANQLREYTKQR